MSTLVLRTVKGSPLTSAEIDANVINLNTDKADKASPTFTGAVTLPNSLLQVTASSYPTIQPTLNLDFANTKLLDPRITFVRNATATYYDGQTTALAEQNLLLQSNFQSGWTAFNGTLTANVVVAPDGTTTASTWVQTASDAQLYQPVANSTLVPYTLSVYVSVPSGTLPFKLRIGTATALSSSILTATTTWQRFTFTVTPTTAITSVVIDTDGTNFGTLNLAFSQLEQRSSVTAYTKTTTSAITNYIPVLMTAPAGVPRFDCDPITGKSLGLLIEESRTNLLTYSSDFSNTIWVLEDGALKTPNTIIAPDGSLTGCKLYSDATTAIHKLRQQVTTTAISYAYYIYAKAGEKRRIVLRDNTVGREGVFDLISGVVISSTGGSGSISSVGNGWYRCSIVGTLGAANTRLQIVVAGDTATSYATSAFFGDGYSGIYVWGAQLEAGSFATPYIPTTTGSVTRAADQDTQAIQVNAYTGSIKLEFIPNHGVSSLGCPLWSSYISASNYSAIFHDGTNMLFRKRIAGTNYDASIALTYVAAQLIKVAVSWSNVNINIAVNGVLGTANTNTLPLQLSSIQRIGALEFLKQANNVDEVRVDGSVKNIAYYPIALSTSNLVALTS